MSTEIFSQTFQEEIYVVPAKPVVALPRPWSEIREKEKILLKKVLSSAKISMSQIKVMESSKPDVLQWSERPTSVIAFGLDANGLAQNEILEIQGIKLILTSSLAEVESMERDLKKKLMDALKQLIT